MTTIIPLIDGGDQIEAIQAICIYIVLFSVSDGFGHLFTPHLLPVPLAIYTERLKMDSGQSVIVG